jgi:hypothetical protein
MRSIVPFVVVSVLCLLVAVPAWAVPTVLSVTRLHPDPQPTRTVLPFRVAFSEPVTGVDVTDFDVVGSVPSAFVVDVSGSGAIYDVRVSTGTGQGGEGAPADLKPSTAYVKAPGGSPTGFVLLVVVDDDTIVAGGVPLGGPGAGNGDFTGGEGYTLDPGAVPIPALGGPALVLLVVQLAAVATVVLWRRRRQAVGFGTKP